METFDAAWLALREPVDHRSRAQPLVDRLARWWSRSDRSDILDLGSGTGSNLRYLAPRLGGRQQWTLVDHDQDLLDRAAAMTTGGIRGGGVETRSVVADLTEGITDHVAGAHLVTASALLDLVSAEWLEELVGSCVGAGAAALFALTYDGTIDWGTAWDPDDAFVHDAVNTHQHVDKGFGAALGPHAASRALELFLQLGYRAWAVATPWRLGADDAELVRALVHGWARATIEVRPEASSRVRAWTSRRSKEIRRPETTLRVGHMDVLALPAAGGTP